MINDKSSSGIKKSPENLSEDLRRCLRERALFHRQFYYRLTNDPETRLKLEKLSNQSSKLLQNHSQNQTVFKSNENDLTNSTNINDPFQTSDKECTNKFIQNNEETHKPLIIQSQLSYDLSNTNINNNKIIKTQQLPTQLYHKSNEHVFKTCFNSTPITTPITNTIKNYSNDVNIQHNQKQLVMLPLLPNTLKNLENINTIQQIQNDVINTNSKHLNSSSCSSNVQHDNHKKNIMNQFIKNDNIKIMKEPRNNTILSEDLMSINVDENNIHIKDTTTTLKPDNNNIKYVSVVDKTKYNCDGIVDYFGVTDVDREACNNSDYSTFLPATTTIRHRHYRQNNENSEFKCLNSLKREFSSPSSSVLQSEINFSLLPSEKHEINNKKNILLPSDLLSSTSVLSSSSSFDKLSTCYPNSLSSSSSSGSSSDCCCMINKHINKIENAINSTAENSNCSEQVDSSDGIQVTKKISSNRSILNQSLRDDNDGYLIKKRKRDLYRKFLKDQQKLKDQNKLLIHRKYEENQNQGEYQFPCVEKLINMYTKILQDKKTDGQLGNSVNKPTADSDEKSGQCISDDTKLTTAEKQTEFQHQGSPVSDEGCLLGLSPYSSDYEEGEPDGSRRIKEKVARSPSSDSALGLDEEVANIQLNDHPESSNSVQHKKGRRQTLTVTDIPLRTALLPVAEPTQLPDSPTLQDSPTNHLNALVTQTAIPSKVLLEERVVEIPEDRFGSLSSSRRESAQSCMSDYNSSEYGGVRFVRTPSVVVSDYSDDVMCGITLEEIEYFRAQRMRRRSSADTATTEKDDACSDVSGSSSCSNLYYCGSTISALDGTDCFVNGIRRKIDRKISDCSMCSTVSGDDDDDFRKQEFPDQLNMDLSSQQQQHLDKDKQLTRKKPSGWRKIRNIVQWTPFFQTYKKQRYPWVQLAGHQGNFKAGPEQGTVLKKLCPKEELCFKVLMKDVLRPYVPEYKGQVTSEDGESVYLQLQDLLSDFYQPCVMDCKIGVRTYLEDELSKAKEKPKLRKDMYEKMIQIDPEAPSDEEHKAKGVTKPRYMVWRETISSTATLGFRIEGIKRSDGTSSKDFKTTKSRSQIKIAFKEYTDDFPHCLPRYLQRLRAIRATLECSDFFRSHEVIGSSLLFVHDRSQANVWLIDFAKTITLPQNHQINHSTTWKVGNHEDGYLIGINNLIELFQELDNELKINNNNNKLDKTNIETYASYNDSDDNNDTILNNSKLELTINTNLNNNITINKNENIENNNYEDEIVSSLNKLQKKSDDNLIKDNENNDKLISE